MQMQDLRTLTNAQLQELCEEIGLFRSNETKITRNNRTFFENKLRIYFAAEKHPNLSFWKVSKIFWCLITIVIGITLIYNGGIIDASMKSIHSFFKNLNNFQAKLIGANFASKKMGASVSKYSVKHKGPLPIIFKSEELEDFSTDTDSILIVRKITIVVLKLYF